LGINKPFLNKLVGQLAQIMHAPYPDLKTRQEDISQVVLNEEVNFINTLKLSSFLVDSELEKIKTELYNDPKKGDFTIASATTSGALGNICFKLYDTNGIPPEITKKELEKRHIKFDDHLEMVYQNELDKQKSLSKSSSKMKGDVFDFKGLGLKLNETEFVGYKEDSVQAEILAVLKDGKEIILDQTPFYAESGGQVGDTGQLINGKNVFEVLNTQKIDNVFLHIGEVKSGSFKKGDKVNARINVERRLNIARNHTATHILQAALRQVLGNHVQQQGSLVGEEKFRFDFTHFKGLSEEEIARVEELANNFVSKNQAVSCKEMSFKEAKKEGALAFFEEKYGENVRVVDIGDISKELCGGTHLANIGEIGLIKIISEGSVASGIRRIEGVTAGFAQLFIKEQEEKAAEESRKRAKLKELKEQEKKRSSEVNIRLREAMPKLIEKGIKINGINVVYSLEPDLDMNALRFLADNLKSELRQSVIVLGSQDNGQKRANLVIALTPDLSSKGLDAGELVRRVAPVIGGSGGGRQDFAQAGGTKPENFTLAFDKLKDIIKGLNIGKAE
jgi:alanyl-tRNA synthetase